jgi:hypothetical protein
MNGFLDGRGGAGEPSGRVAGGAAPPVKAAKAEGVREVASAGGGRPVSLAASVRIQRRIVKIPRTDPRVFRRLPNCSATDTIAR